MAAPELQNTPLAGENRPPAPTTDSITAPPPAAPIADDSDWFQDYERVEKVFYVLSPVLFVSGLVTYLGLLLENNPIFMAGVVVLIVTLVAMSGLIMPLSLAFLKGFRHWRRQRAAQGSRAQREG